MPLDNYLITAGIYGTLKVFSLAKSKWGWRGSELGAVWPAALRPTCSLGLCTSAGKASSPGRLCLSTPRLFRDTRKDEKGDQRLPVLHLRLACCQEEADGIGLPRSLGPLLLPASRLVPRRGRCHFPLLSAGAKVLESPGSSTSGRTLFYALLTPTCPPGCLIYFHWVDEQECE